MSTSTSRIPGVTEMTSEVALKNPEPRMEQVSKEFSGKRILRRFDSLDRDSSTVPGRHGQGSKVCLYIALKKQISPAYIVTSSNNEVKVLLLLL